MDPHSGRVYESPKGGEGFRKFQEAVGLVPLRKECAENLRKTAPEAIEPIRNHPLMKGRLRNTLCPCESGKKVKHCCGK